jgi:hypothetical protein
VTKKISALRSTSNTVRFNESKERYKTCVSPCVDIQNEKIIDRLGEVYFPIGLI